MDPGDGGPGNGGPWRWRTLGMADPGNGGPWGWRTGTESVCVRDRPEEVKYRANSSNEIKNAINYGE